MISRTRSTATTVSPPRRISSRLVRIGASGFLSSCASIARNSSFRALACRNCSSARARSMASQVRSAVSLTNPTSSGVQSRGERSFTNRAATSLPSLINGTATNAPTPTAERSASGINGEVWVSATTTGPPIRNVGPIQLKSDNEYRPTLLETPARTKFRSTTMQPCASSISA